MVEPKMTDVCANCGMRYGRHQLIGNSCPKRGQRWSYQATTFKKKRRPSSTGATKP